MNTATRLGTKSALLSVSSYLILAPSALGAGLVHGRDVDRGGAPVLLVRHAAVLPLDLALKVAR